MAPLQTASYYNRRARLVLQSESRINDQANESQGMKYTRDARRAQ
jgi:hypothetical protein